jgi:hypothetical protein
MVRPPGRLIKRADVALGVALGRRRPGRCSWGRAGPATAVAGRQAIECDSTSSPPEGPDESALSILANLRGRPIRVARAWRVAVLRPRRLGRTTTLSGAGRGQGDAPRRRTALARGGHWRRQRPVDAERRVAVLLLKKRSGWRLVEPTTLTQALASATSSAP